jgi:hypothetical protein
VAGTQKKTKMTTDEVMSMMNEFVTKTNFPVGGAHVSTQDSKPLETYKIAVMIPCTSRNREMWRNMRDTYVFKHALKTLTTTADMQHQYMVYIGVDDGDRIFSSKREQASLIMFNKVWKHRVSIRYVSMDGIIPGCVTKMWNRIFDVAYREDECDYFVQCPDDIVFLTKGWVNDSIEVLKANDDIGVTGVSCGDNLTATVVSRVHRKIFGYYFPEDLLNQGYQDWIQHAYGDDNTYCQSHHKGMNVGGESRCDMEDDAPNRCVGDQVMFLAQQGHEKVMNYVMG